MDDGGDDPFGTQGTIGIEEEFFLVDDAGNPAGGTDDLCYENEPPEILQDRLDHELFTFVIETQTPVIDSLEEAPEVLSAVRSALVEYAAEHGYGVAAAGLHPSARWRELDHVTKPRYRRQLDRIQYPQHRNITAGLHIHVGVSDPEAAVWISNEIRWYLPLLLALSANSPFWNGFDTGLASARARIFEALPNTGMPSALDSYDDYLQLESTLLETGSISDRGEIWFDVRPHTEYGTVEIRTPDAQAEEETVLAFTEYACRLIERLDEGFRRLDAGETPAEVYRDVHADWVIPPEDGDLGAAYELLCENKWRAIRYGHEAAFIDRHGDGEVDLERAATTEIDRFALERLPTVLEGQSGAKRLREVLKTEGIEAACDEIRLDRA